MGILNQFIESTNGIEVLPIISLVFFFGIFTLISIWALRLKKGDVEKMKEIPFDDNKC